jgi:Flp pilus assembly protein TadB
MLSHEDERRLNAIEQHMRDEDPEFVRRFRRRATTSMSARRTLVTMGIAVLCSLGVLGVLVAVVGLVTGSVVLILTGCGLAAVAAYELRRMRRPRRPH